MRIGATAGSVWGMVRIGVSACFGDDANRCHRVLVGLVRIGVRVISPRVVYTARAQRDPGFATITTLGRPYIVPGK